MVSLEQAKAAAVNSAAIKNAEGIIKKKKYKALAKSEDESYIYGEFTGSGAKDYIVYVDTLEGIKAKCSCPSRQIPCKHALALMMLGAMGEISDIVEIPEEVMSKREKKVKALEKAKEKLENGKLTKSEEKKLNILEDGLKYLEDSLAYIMKRGLKNYKDSNEEELDKIYKGLGDYKLVGTQIIFYEFKENLKYGDLNGAINLLIVLNQIIKKGRDDIENKISKNKLEMNKLSTIESLVATNWKVDELEANELMKENRELMQLSLYVQNHQGSQKNYIGVYIDLEDGKIYVTNNYTGYGLNNGDENSILNPIEVKKLFIYPGTDFNRVKIGDFKEKDLNEDILNKILSYSKENYEEEIKRIKRYFNNPLIIEDGYLLLSYKSIFIKNDDVYIENNNGQVVNLINSNILKFISKDYKEGAILIKVNKSLADGKLSYRAMSIISEKGMLHLS